jgi:hypothetical protein
MVTVVTWPRRRPPALEPSAAGCRSATLKLLHAEADALLLDVDVENDGRNLLALAVQSQRVLARDAPCDV